MPLVVTIPPALRKPLGDEGAEALAQLLNDATGAARDETIRLSDEKFARRLTEEIGKLRAEVHDEIGKLRADISRLDDKFERRLTEETARLRVDLANTKTTIIFWVVGLWVVQLVAMVVARFIG